MAKNRSPLVRIFTVFFTSALCVSLLVLGYILVKLPQYTFDNFGSPSPHLSLIEQYTLSARLLFYTDDLNKPADIKEETHSFNVQIGESSSSIVTHLFQEGLISDKEALQTYLQYKGMDTTIQAGIYSLSASMSPLDIANRMQNATSSHVTMQILAGWRIEEIAASLPTSGLNISPSEFKTVVNHPPSRYSFSPYLPQNGSLEGFLSPGTYTFRRNIPAMEFVNTLVVNFEKQLTDDLLQHYSDQGLNIFEAVTLASIIEREVIIDEEMPMIASVFYNRLNAGMKLDSDPTVQYALGFNTNQNTWWKNPLNSEDYQISSPYNTYIYKGLPPGPIANPSQAALQAVAFPEQTPYFYFRAACNDTNLHNFAQNLTEHINNSCPE